MLRCKGQGAISLLPCFQCTLCHHMRLLTALLQEPCIPQHSALYSESGL